MNAIGVRRCSPAVGAIVTGVDLHEPISDAAMADVWRALHDHGVIFFRDQHVEPDRQVEFARRLGTVLVVPELSAHAVPGQPAVLRVTNTGKQATLTENWHFDSAFFAHPPPITVLAAEQVPDIGGDTMWADQYRAYETLSPAMRKLIDPLLLAFVGTLPGGRGEVTTFHPVVATHPATGRRALRIGRPESAPHFEGMTPDESRGLLEFLYDHASRPDLAYRHAWRAGDVAVWDNRCLLHYAIHDYGDADRLMHRVTVSEAADV